MAIKLHVLPQSAIPLSVGDQAVIPLVAGIGYANPYTGDYEVTPTTDGFSLPTKGLVMTDDMTVKKIPYYEMHNDSGTTVYIASEV